MKKTRSALENVCPYTKTISLIGSYWNLMIIKELYLQQKMHDRKEMRFNELLKCLEPISSKTLTAKIRELQDFGIIIRKVVDNTPVLITYELTEKGIDLNRVMDAMADWSTKWNIKKESK